MKNLRRKMNILLTGHGGLIGTSLKKRLEERGDRVIGIDLRSGFDVCDIDSFKLKEKIDLVIHAAAHCKINQSVTEPERTYQNNVLGSWRVFEFCRKNNIKKILFFSSSRILSKEKNPYTASKIYGEELAKAYKDSYGIDYIIVRPSTVYGPFWDETKRLIHIFITNALRGKDLEIYGNPKTKTLDFTYVEDFVDGVMLALGGQWNKEYNISGDEEFNVYELAKFIIEQTGSKSKIVVKDAEVAQPQKVKVDTSEIKKIGYKPLISVRTGVIRTIDFYRIRANL